MSRIRHFHEDGTSIISNNRVVQVKDIRTEINLSRENRCALKCNYWDDQISVVYRGKI